MIVRSNNKGKFSFDLPAITNNPYMEKIHKLKEESFRKNGPLPKRKDSEEISDDNPKDLFNNI